VDSLTLGKLSSMKSIRKYTTPKPQVSVGKASSYPLKTNSVKGIMRIDIPKINVHAGVLKGVGNEQAQLAQGPSLLEGSPMPNTKRTYPAIGLNVTIGAHRSTFGAWFRYINELKNGDDIILTQEGKVYTYKVVRTFIENASGAISMDSLGYKAGSVTLYACHPVGSANQRYFVVGELSNVK